MLERAFAGWQSRAVDATRQYTFVQPATVPPQTAHILLFDRPGSPQSLILGGLVLAQRGTTDDLALTAADDVLGGSSLSRLNLDIREKRGWAYGVSSAVTRVRGRMPLLLSAPVQTDRTGASLTAIIADMTALRGPQPVTQAERDRTVANTVRSLPGEFESGASVLASLERNLIFETARRLSAATRGPLRRADAGADRGGGAGIRPGARDVDRGRRPCQDRDRPAQDRSAGRGSLRELSMFTHACISA